MKIQLSTKPEFIAKNITEASSLEFANLLRELMAVPDSEKVEGHFSLSRVGYGKVTLELTIKKK